MKKLLALLPLFIVATALAAPIERNAFTTNEQTAVSNPTLTGDWTFGGTISIDSLEADSPTLTGTPLLNGTNIHALFGSGGGTTFTNLDEGTGVTTNTGNLYNIGNMVLGENTPWLKFNDDGGLDFTLKLTGDSLYLYNHPSNNIVEISQTGDLNITGTYFGDGSGLTGIGGGSADWTNMHPTVINVSDAPYNAVGDGVTDDTAAIQAALQAAQGDGWHSMYDKTPALMTGGVLYFPQGKYLYDSEIDITNQFITIIGDGKDRTVLLPTNNANGIRLSGAPCHTVLKDFTICGYDGTTGTGIIGDGAETNLDNFAVPFIGYSDFDVAIRNMNHGIHIGRFQDGRIRAEIVFSDIGVILTNGIHSSDFSIQSHRYDNTGFLIGDWERCHLTIRDSDISGNQTGTNVIRIMSHMNSTTISGRCEFNSVTNRVGVFFEGGQIQDLKFEDFHIRDGNSEDCWSFYVPDDPYGAGSIAIQCYLLNCRLDVGHNSYNSARLRLSHGGVQNFSFNGMVAPMIAGFHSGSLVTNFVGGQIITHYRGPSQRTFPASYPNYMHQPYIYRPNSSGWADSPEELNVNMYDTNNVPVAVAISEPWFQIRDGIVPKVTESNYWTGYQNFAGDVNFTGDVSGITNVAGGLTPTNSPAEDGWVLESSGADTKWQRQPSKYIYVEDYGAVADDGIDDSAAFSNAVEYANGVDGRLTVQLQAGQYDFTNVGPFTITNDHIYVVGQGSRTTVLKWDKLSASGFYWKRGASDMNSGGIKGVLLDVNVSATNYPNTGTGLQFGERGTNWLGQSLSIDDVVVRMWGTNVAVGSMLGLKTENLKSYNAEYDCLTIGRLDSSEINGHFGFHNYTNTADGLRGWTSPSSLTNAHTMNIEGGFLGGSGFFIMRRCEFGSEALGILVHDSTALKIAFEGGNCERIYSAPFMTLTNCGLGTAIAFSSKMRFSTADCPYPLIRAYVDSGYSFADDYTLDGVYIEGLTNYLVEEISPSWSGLLPSAIGFYAANGYASRTAVGATPTKTASFPTFAFVDDVNTFTDNQIFGGGSFSQGAIKIGGNANSFGNTAGSTKYANICAPLTGNSGSTYSAHILEWLSASSGTSDQLLIGGGYLTYKGPNKLGFATATNANEASVLRMSFQGPILYPHALQSVGTAGTRFPPIYTEQINATLVTGTGTGLTGIPTNAIDTTFYQWVESMGVGEGGTVTNEFPLTNAYPVLGDGNDGIVAVTTGTFLLLTGAQPTNGNLTSLSSGDGQYTGNLNASSLASGTVPRARLATNTPSGDGEVLASTGSDYAWQQRGSTNVSDSGTNSTFQGSLTVTGPQTNGTVRANTVIGNGSGLTNVSQRVFVGSTLLLSTTSRNPTPTWDSTTAVPIHVPTDRTMVFSNLWATAYGIDVGTNGTMTLRTNDVATALTITFVGQGTTTYVTTNSGTATATVQAGDYWGWHWQGNNPTNDSIEIGGSYELLYP